MELLKSKKKMAIIGAALAAVVALGGISMHANAAIKVNTYTVTKTDMEKIVDGGLCRRWIHDGRGTDSDECGCAVPAVYAKGYVDRLQ